MSKWVSPSHSLVYTNLQPCTIHNFSLAVEDAAVFGVLMSHLRSRNQIPQLLEAFQDLRYSRVQQVQQSELNNAKLVCLPPGEFRDMRDAGMALSLNPSTEPWDDARLREQWDEIGGVFGYNAREAAEDWWIKWGSLGDGTRGHAAHESFNLVFAVTEVAVSDN
jgi:salicylate hydroxylase